MSCLCSAVFAFSFNGEYSVEPLLRCTYAHSHLAQSLQASFVRVQNVEHLHLFGLNRFCCSYLSGTVCLSLTLAVKVWCISSRLTNCVRHAMVAAPDIFANLHDLGHGSAATYGSQRSVTPSVHASTGSLVHLCLLGRGRVLLLLWEVWV